MSCEDTQVLLTAYVDGELDLVRCLEIEKHLETCPACAQIVQNQKTLGTALRSGSLYYRPPRQLEERIHTALHGLQSNRDPDASIGPYWPWLRASCWRASSWIAWYASHLIRHRRT